MNELDNLNKHGREMYDRAFRDNRTMMAPLDAPRWYDGEPKKPERRVIKRADLHTSLWLIRICVAAPGVQVDHQ